MAFAFIFFIFGMTYTSAATTLFMIGTQPLFAGLFAYIFLREYVRAATLIACLISLGGMFIMAYNDWQSGTLLGWTFGLLCSISFATFAVTLRWQPDTPKFTTIMIAGVVCALFSVLMIYFFVLFLYYDKSYMGQKLFLLSHYIVGKFVEQKKNLAEI